MMKAGQFEKGGIAEVKVLYIDATVRRDSRTKIVAEALLEKIEMAAGEKTIETVRLVDAGLTPLDEQTLKLRDKAAETGDYSDPYFDVAKQFAEADLIVMSAPYYDLSFPSSVKVYLENVCIQGVTFQWGVDGVPIGLSKARKIFYVTTAGGGIGEYNLGYDYVKTLCVGMLGVKGAQCLSAVGLDVAGTDPDEVVIKAVNGIRNRDLLWGLLDT